jgi:hypothetical protein
MSGCPAWRSRLIARFRRGCHHLGAVPGADLAAVLVEGDVPHPVRPVPDLPLAADQRCQAGGIGPGSVRAGDAVADLGAQGATGKVGGVPRQHQHLRRMGEPRRGGRRGGLEATLLDAAVAPLNRLVRRGKRLRGRRSIAAARPGWLSLTVSR